MARPVLVPRPLLTAVFILLLGFVSISGFAPSTEKPPSECSPDSSAGVTPSDRKQVHDFQEQVKSGPFFKELVARLGKPVACKTAVQDGAISLVYSFRKNGRLVSRISPGIEATEQSLHLQTISRKKAIALLKESERHSFGQGGCGITWNRPAEDTPGDQTGSHELVYRGEACNCQGRVLYSKGQIVGLVLRSAC